MTTSASEPVKLLGGRYQPLHLLGKKAGRQTWLAQDLQTGAQVVVKLLTFGSEFEWDDLKLFEREAETLRSLDHPAIPSYLDYFELDAASHRGFALVQTYIEARSLEQHLKSGRTFSEADVRHIAIDLLEILQYLHDRQPPVIHRDIKPSNILLGDRSGNHPGQVYLVDFGSVQTLAVREGGTITIVGTYGYMPPEQFGGRATPASDLYSLGATFIYLVTGQHPAELPQEDLRLKFEPLVDLNLGFLDWLKQLTEPSLNKRFASAKLASQGLQRSLTAPRTERSALQSQRPINTQIVLNKDRDFIEVLLPRTSLDFRRGDDLLRLIAFMVGMVLCAPAVILLFGTMVAFASLNLSMVTSLLLAVILASIIPGVPGLLLLQPLLQRIALDFRRYRFQRQPERTLVYIKGHSITLYDQTGRAVLARCDRSHYGFTTPELEWLAHEISTWLEIPVISRNR